MKASCAILVLCGVLWGGDAGAVCDRHQGENDSAQAMHAKGDKPDQAAAIAIVKAVLRAEPGNFRANYLLGLIETDESGVDRANGAHDAALAKAGVAQLDSTVEILKQADESCAQAGNWYSVYNSAGAEHFNIGDFKGAEKYLLAGYAVREKMKPETQRKLLSNLGRLYSSTHNFDRAARFYAEGQKAGAAGAAQNVATVQQLKGAFALTRPSIKAAVAH
jgi:tetratricopeptide (TPR) repeat protein